MDYKELQHAHSCVLCCALSPDGRTLVTGSHGPFIYVWDTGTGNNVKTISDVVDHVRDIVFMSDGVRVVVAYQNLIRVVNIDTETVEHTHTYPAHITCIDVASDDSMVVLADRGMITRIADPFTGAHHQLYAHHRLVRECKFAPDTTLVASNDEDFLRLWDPRTRVQIRAYAVQAASFAFSPNSQSIAIVDWNGTATLVDNRTGACLPQFACATGLNLLCQFSHDGRHLITSTAGIILFWSMLTYNSDNTILFRPNNIAAIITDVAVSSSNGVIIASSVTGHARMWPLPPNIDTRIKALLMVVIGNRRRRLRLPMELWLWMEEQGFL